MTGKPKSKRRERASNPLSALFSFRTRVEFVSSYPLEKCLKRITAQRNLKFSPTTLNPRVSDTPPITVEISQDTADEATFVIEDLTQRHALIGYRNRIEGRLERLDKTTTLVQIKSRGFGEWFLYSAAMLMFMGFVGVQIPICLPIVMLVGFFVSVYILLLFFSERTTQPRYIRSILGSEPRPGSQKRTTHVTTTATPNAYRLVDDGEVVPLDEPPTAKTSHHGSNSK